MSGDSFGIGGGGIPPVVAITMGEPAGVGPEITLSGFLSRPPQAPYWLYVGDPAVLEWAARQLGAAIKLVPVERPDQVMELPPGTLGVWPLNSGVRPERLAWGRPDPRHAAAVVESIATACQLAMSGAVAGICTNPLHKGVLHQGGFKIPGHTELLGELTATPHPVMMLYGGGLRVVPATIHQSLASVPATLTPELLERVITTTVTALENDFALPDPRLTVAGLNPHAGENGAFGREELEWIAPLCARLSGACRLRGPLPADTLFHPAARATYDAVICMYHDQALIPLKMLAFGEAVNLTLGLPIVRTSVDHGTAFDLAGQGRAAHSSLVIAAELAYTVARNRAATSLRGFGGAGPPNGSGQRSGFALPLGRLSKQSEFFGV